MVRDAAEFIIGPRFARTRWRLVTMRQFYDFARVTTSPSSFTNDPAGWSSRSSTASVRLL
jgi:hypothetical protein